MAHNILNKISTRKFDTPKSISITTENPDSVIKTPLKNTLTVNPQIYLSPTNEHECNKNLFW